MTTQSIKPIPESSDRTEAWRYQSAIQTFQCQWMISTLSEPRGPREWAIPRPTGDTGKWEGKQPDNLELSCHSGGWERLSHPSPASLPSVSLSTSGLVASTNQPTNRNSWNQVLPLHRLLGLHHICIPTHSYYKYEFTTICLITCPLGTSRHWRHTSENTQRSLLLWALFSIQATVNPFMRFTRFQVLMWALCIDWLT